MRRDRVRIERLSIVFLAALLPAGMAAAARPDARFTRIGIEQGLSQSSVQAILQDHAGFLWLGTDEGLDRFDGYSFVVFRHDPRNPRSLPNDAITVLHEDRQQRLWVGTDRGLCVLDPARGSFERIPPIHEKVSAVVEDADGRLWVATDGEGLFERDPKTGAFVSHLPNPDDPASLASYSLTALLRDRRGRLWIASSDAGLDLLDEGGRRFVHHRHDPRDPRSLGDNYIWGRMAEDATGNLWVATYGGGLSIRDQATGSFRHYRHDPAKPGSIASDLLTCVLRDRSGTMWIGSDGKGLQRYDAATDGFVRLSHDHSDLASLSQNVVRTLYEDRQGQLWVGTYLGGVNVLSRPRRFRYFTHDATDPTGLSDAAASFLEDGQGRIWIGTGQGWLNLFDEQAGTFVYSRFPSAVRGGAAILALHQDLRGRIWMGTYRGGLARFDPKDGSFVLFKHRDQDPRSLANDEVWVIRGDADGSLWLGTNDGVDRFDPERGIVLEHYDTYHQEGLSETGARALLIDRKGNLWVGSLGGLDLRLRDGGGFVRYRHDDRDPQSISHDIVMALHEDRKGRLWVGTFGGGLNRLDPATGTFTVYRNLPSNVVYGIQEDAAGWLWMSTNHGLSHFDPETGHVENFDLTNGLQSLQFRIGAGLRMRSGRMLFASVDGFYAFDPQTLEPERFAPPVVVTATRVLNEPAAPATAISNLSAIRVSHHDKIISFEFAALDFTFPRRNQYAYTLDGFSDGWVQLGTKRDVTFTNLDPGTYVFRVRASNSDGVWSESSRTEQKLIVEQTLWRRPWLQGLAALLLVITIVCVGRSASRWRPATRA